MDRREYAIIPISFILLSCMSIKWLGTYVEPAGHYLPDLLERMHETTVELVGALTEQILGRYHGGMIGD